METEVTASKTQVPQPDLLSVDRRRKLQDPATRAKLIKALLEGGSPEQLANSFECSPQAIRQFRRKHIDPAMEVANQLGLANNEGAGDNKHAIDTLSKLAGDSSLIVELRARHAAEAQKRKAQVDQWLGKTESPRDAASLIRVAIAADRYEAELDGSISAATVNVDNRQMVVIMPDTRGSQRHSETIDIEPE